MGRGWKMGRRVEVILVWRRRRHCWGGGKSGQLLLPFLVVNVSQAVVEMGVGVIVDLGGDNCAHERWLVGYTRQGASATRGPWRLFVKNTNIKQIKNTNVKQIKNTNATRIPRRGRTLEEGELLQSLRHIGEDDSKLVCVDPYPAQGRHVESNFFFKRKLLHGYISAIPVTYEENFNYG